MEISNLRKDIIDIKNLLKLPKKVSNPNDVGLMDLILDQITASSNINNNTSHIYAEAKEIKELFVNFKNVAENGRDVLLKKLSNIDIKTDNLAKLVSFFELPEELKDFTISSILIDMLGTAITIQNNTADLNYNNVRHREIFNYLHTIDIDTSHLPHISVVNENIRTKITNIEENFKLPDGAEFNFATTLMEMFNSMDGHILNIYNKLNNEINMQLRSINNSLISIDGRLQEKLTPILTALNQIVTNTTK